MKRMILTLLCVFAPFFGDWVAEKFAQLIGGDTIVTFGSNLNAYDGRGENVTVPESNATPARVTATQQRQQAQQERQQQAQQQQQERQQQAQQERQQQRADELEFEKLFNDRTTQFIDDVRAINEQMNKR